jgi:hypothetical protein
MIAARGRTAAVSEVMWLTNTARVCSVTCAKRDSTTSSSRSSGSSIRERT